MSISTDPAAVRERFASPPDRENLTRHEWSGLANEHNLADGHARQAQSPPENAVVERLARLFRQAEAANQLEVQRAFEEAYFRRAGQASVLRRAHRPLHHYSSSISTEVLANYLRERRMRVGLLHPTFDNIAGILRRHALDVTPVPERIFDDPHDAALYEGRDAIFLVTPNNPTGVDPAPETIKAIADRCRADDLLLILDMSFRFFSRHLHGWDQYEYFDALGLSYVGIEDTGKTWPTLDLKVGSLVVDGRLHPALQQITDDFLLNVSPFVFRVLRDYIEANEELDGIRVGRANRATLEEALRETCVTIVRPEAPMSVAWLRLPDAWSSPELCDWLDGQGVSVLPGCPFFWADRERGQGFVRVALMRPEDDFVRGAGALAQALRRYDERSDTMTANENNDEVGELVVKLCREVLERADVHLDDDFFSVGGDSLSAMHLIGRLRQETGLPLRVRALFEEPTLRGLAGQVAEGRRLDEGDELFAGPDPRAILQAAFEDDRRPDAAE